MMRKFATILVKMSVKKLLKAIIINNIIVVMKRNNFCFCTIFRLKKFVPLNLKYYYEPISET